MTTSCLIPDMGRPCGLCEACRSDSAGPVCPMCGGILKHPMIGSGGLFPCTSCRSGIQRGTTDLTDDQERIMVLEEMLSAVLARACGFAFAAGIREAELEAEVERVRSALLRGAA